MERPRDARRRPDDVRQDDDDNKTLTGDAAREAKRRALMREIAARLGPVCQHLTDAEFAQLVSDVAIMKLRFAAIDAGIWARRDPADRSTRDPPAGPADM